MTFKWTAIAATALVAGLALVAADPALARAKRKAFRPCAEAPQTFSFGSVFFNPAPRANGCAPAVYNYGRYVGQDPDPFIRQQLMRDPQTGYTQF